MKNHFRLFTSILTIILLQGCMNSSVNFNKQKFTNLKHLKVKREKVILEKNDVEVSNNVEPNEDLFSQTKEKKDSIGYVVVKSDVQEKREETFQQKVFLVEKTELEEPIKKRIELRNNKRTTYKFNRSFKKAVKKIDEEEEEKKDRGRWSLFLLALLLTVLGGLLVIIALKWYVAVFLLAIAFPLWLIAFILVCRSFFRFKRTKSNPTFKSLINDALFFIAHFWTGICLAAALLVGILITINGFI